MVTGRKPHRAAALRAELNRFRLNARRCGEAKTNAAFGLML